ncbi:MAG: hypothetical protein H6696_13265 [Deferribacteres bacterium]|nr:hypothetical protein [candidate division KSB1 bacterium]MCB9502900.1 hypothetical protein [Deferribacteres bacterium]
MHRSYFGLTVLLLSGILSCAMAKENERLLPKQTDKNKNHTWDKKEIFLLSSYWLGSLFDAGQTVYGLDKGGKELNPVLGQKPGRVKIYGLKLGLGIFASALCHHSETKDRKYMLGLMNAIQWSAVVWNGKFAGVGLRMQF